MVGVGGHRSRLGWSSIVQQVIGQGRILQGRGAGEIPPLRGLAVALAHVSGQLLQIRRHHFIRVWCRQRHANLPKLAALQQREALAFWQADYVRWLDHRMYMSARGRPLTQARVREWSKAPGLVLLCGRFEGVDQRVLDARGFEEISVGDAVLAGGEAAAMVTIEACVRLLPGVLGQAASLDQESFEDGLLEHPQYTRPQEFEGLKIPEVLRSGHHGEIARWRQEQREATTQVGS